MSRRLLREPSTRSTTARHGRKSKPFWAGPPGDYGGGQRRYSGGNCEGWTCSDFYHRSYFKKNGPTAEEIETAIQRGNLSLWWGRHSAIAVGFDGEGKVT